MDFVYESRAGEGIFIYVLDCGVEMQVKNVSVDVLYTGKGPANWANRKAKTKTAHHKRSSRTIYSNGNGEGMEDFQTSDSKEAGENPNKDDAPLPKEAVGHGTPVAAKALGRIYGVAKKATLISVKAVTTSGSVSEGLELILEDVTDIHPERADKRVVIYARHFPSEGKSPDEWRDSNVGRQFTCLFKDLADAGVPVVVSSGNARSRNQEIDTIPAVLEGPDVPIIVVGAASKEGRRELYSQGGDQLTVYAPGTVNTQSKEDGKDVGVLGTSFCKCRFAALHILFSMCVCTKANIS
jgi:hypothetical protein